MYRPGYEPDVLINCPNKARLRLDGSCLEWWCHHLCAACFPWFREDMCIDAKITNMQQDRVDSCTSSFKQMDSDAIKTTAIWRFQLFHKVNKFINSDTLNFRLGGIGESYETGTLSGSNWPTVAKCSLKDVASCIRSSSFLTDCAGICLLRWGQNFLIACHSFLL